MAYFANDAVNRVNLHSAIQAFAQAGGGVFVLVFLLRGGLSVSAALVVMAAILSVRFALRPLILPLAKRWGLRPLLMFGTIVIAAQYPIVAGVQGIGPALVTFCLVAAIGEILYWPSYNAYFASIGDAEHRGHQLGAREAFVAVAGVVAPLLGAWALVALGPHPMFAAFGVIQALAVLPLLGAPDVAVRQSAPGSLRAARIGALLYATDGWFDAFIFVWLIALFVTLGQDFSSYGGAMALAALVGAASGLVLGRHIDAGHGRRSVGIAYGVAAILVILRIVSLGSPWLAVVANAIGAPVMSLMLPTLGAATYNLAKASPCPLRFGIAAEAGWDLGCISACLITAALVAAGVPLSFSMIGALPALAVAATVLRRHYGSLATA